ncbi:hypothetical protein SAMN05444008_10546 [Cnuella takakiae]|uniref:SnoaL-like domain-containing protein n=1 Tax=Cnuella takakiae TaxID=1302690 RepID=A0A1M4Z0J0_9BACT|nr:hypothetical protein [Cnuella takakiae]OLY94365.1 hypothetical protein BUE76_22630 [Cnuella takakiae]SHF11593.1 hypothetical protein SAMN05444008_10546 [Cnuella takakiae]
MNLPNVVTGLIKSQEQFDSAAFANFFAADAVVFDEGKTHQGRMAIQQWNAQTNQEYQTTLQPMGYAETEGGGVLTTQVSGTFPGSPIVAKYHLQIADDLIQSLKIAV